MGGGGGDGGYLQRQERIEAEKAKARAALNQMFGVSTPAGAAPSRDAFTKTVAEGAPVGVDFQGDGGGYGGSGTYKKVFDEAGYKKALSDWELADDKAAANKAGREKLYDTVRSSAFDAGKADLDEDREQAARDLKFSLFAQGLNGGSVDIDQNATLGRTYDKGVLKLGGLADSARADFMGNDEQTRLGLLQSIDAGMDQGSALSSALAQMKVNADKAASQAQGVSLGDLFADAGLLYTKSNAARGRQAADDLFAQTYPRWRTGMGGGSGVAITPTS